MDYPHALRRVHEMIEPTNYSQIGGRLGISLALSRAPSIGIDPDFEIRTELTAPTRLYRKPATPFCLRRLRQRSWRACRFRIHRRNLSRRIRAARLYQHRETFDAKRPNCNRRFAPEELRYASRQRETQIWTGDVYRVIPILGMFRPGLEVHDIEMKGSGSLAVLIRHRRSCRRDTRASVADLARGRWAPPSPDAVRRTPRPAAGR